MISQTVEYALRAVVSLAQNPGKPLTTVEIAKLTKVPEHYLSKVLHTLAKGKIVRSQRGLHGGYVLDHPVDELPLLSIINVVDPIQQIEKCPLKLETHGTNLCALHKKINHSIHLMEEVFRNSTIQTILDEPSQSIPLCDS
ncbi:MAG: Rrf2 family transcriptional regulator [Candidatus Nitrohelix vancouverensis]|uniref:Rrf2 family transcriptional regulator n=1 Tax=Candidatus Nitrohelix vancouverensis TaxID=2705534 RepID=A0A7T0C0E5_9BACT|nr:MAG: Rrf2 family transcriptional regulator [Candidatus Nitrohelix vancouverensis]